MYLLIEGLPHTGKTNLLQNYYISIIRTGLRTDNILVLLSDTSQILKWKNNIQFKLKYAGSFQVFTYWGFIQKELNKYWHWIVPTLGFTSHSIQPIFLNAESAHYLMTLIVEEARPNNSLNMIVATSSQIALQILNNLNQAAVNGLNIEEAEKRLLQTCLDDSYKTNIYKDSFKIAKIFRQLCLNSNCLDYSLVVELYNKHLLNNPRYKDSLVKRFKCLIVDNLEEAIPTQIDLINKLLPNVNEAYFAFDPSGGHSRSFGAAPELVKQIIYPHCSTIELKELKGCSPEAAELAATIGYNIRYEQKKKITSRVINFKTINTEFRAKMISELGQEIINLLLEGCLPNDIAVITPSVDKVLEHTLNHQLGEAGFSIQSLSQKTYLADEEYAQVLVNIAAMIQPSLSWSVSISSLARCFAIILELDPIRSTLLARNCISNGIIKLVDLDETRLREKIGFETSRKYDLIKSWVEKVAEQTEQTENLFQQIFSEILAPIVRNQDDIVTSRQLIHSAIKFRRVYEAVPYFKQQPFVERFLELITKGTVASEAYYRKELKENAVIISTPRSFFKSGLSVKHQFWVDCSSPVWFRGDHTELSNPFILSRNWHGIWDDLTDQKLRRNKAATMIEGLLYRCKDNVTIVESNFSSLGFELDGHLSEIIFESVVKPK